MKKIENEHGGFSRHQKCSFHGLSVLPIDNLNYNWTELKSNIISVAMWRWQHWDQMYSQMPHSHHVHQFVFVVIHAIEQHSHTKWIWRKIRSNGTPNDRYRTYTYCCSVHVVYFVWIGWSNYPHICDFRASTDKKQNTICQIVNDSMCIGCEQRATPRCRWHFQHVSQHHRDFWKQKILTIGEEQVQSDK